MDPVQPGEEYLEYLEPYESLFARDLEGRIIRMEKATLSELQETVKLKIDGIDVEIPKAVPDTDDQGNIRLDANRFVVPRRTTIYDAANKVYTRDEDAGPVPRNRNPIPILCHQDHLKPMGLCRVCAVLIVKGRAVSSKLEPACHHPVSEGMEVHTVKSTASVLIPGTAEPQCAGEYVRKAVSGLLQLLGGDHLHDPQVPTDRRFRNELLDLAGDQQLLEATLSDADSNRVQLTTPYFRKEHIEMAVDTSSRIINVDHNKCILCDRCVRACSEVRPFQIIGHTGYGNKARISFDLNAPMGESECVSCGECAISCPTGALMFKGTVYDEQRERGINPWHDMAPLDVKTVRAEDLARIVARYAEGPVGMGDVPAMFKGLEENILQRLASLFARISYAFLRWNQGAIGMLQCKPGDVLCRKDDYGSAAFLILDGEIGIEGVAFRLTPDAIIVGEMACMSNQRRTATLVAATPAKVIVLRRNVLHALQRNKVAKEVLHKAYRERAVSVHLSKGVLFAGLSPQQNRQCVDFLRANRDRLEFIEADPGQVLFRQGAPADFFDIVHRGHVQVSKTTIAGQEVAYNYLGEGRQYGEIALMSDPEISPRVAAELPDAERGRRTASCVALDHVELVRVGKDLFRELIALDGVRDHFERVSIGLVRNQPKLGMSLMEFNRQGLHQGQSLLVLDLNKCTRCQECVKGCSDSHGGVTRLVLEGERYDHFLVPSACRSCHDPVCLIGCPVDSIHRRAGGRASKRNDRFAIVIEDWCIGCGLCAYNCPFGSIHMHAKAEGPKPPLEATNCDLCESLDAVPRCVHACPHDAAHRMRGEELANLLGMPVLASAPRDLRLA